MRHGSLFSGIGGFDLAAEWMGWENVFHCEWNEFGQKVLKYYWPQAESFSDITKTDFTKYANTIDILTGGFPCQPFSNAGQRKGTDDERYLWGEMLRAIQEIKPRFVIAENVFGITNIDGGLVFQQVCLDLENEGYEVQPFIIPACAKNAPHRRDRCWFIAQNPLFSRCLHGEPNKEGAEIREFGDIGTRGADGICLSTRDLTDSKRLRLQIGSKTRYISKEKSETFEERSEFTIPIEANGCGYRKSEWENFPTQSPICGRDDGLPTSLDGIAFSKWREQSIKGYGNAIVPQIAYQLFQIINDL